MGTNGWIGEFVLGPESQDPKTKEAGERRTEAEQVQTSRGLQTVSLPALKAQGLSETQGSYPKDQAPDTVKA